MERTTQRLMERAAYYQENARFQFHGALVGATRCPHCAVATPLLTLVHQVDFDVIVLPDQGTRKRRWGFFKCSRCCNLISARGYIVANPDVQTGIEALFPDVDTMPEDLPERASSYLSQAIESLHAPDGATMLAGSAVDAMLKEKGFRNGSVYNRIDEARDANILTEDMATWAHSVRLGANRPRHADANDPHVSPEEAAQAVDFARILGDVLFVLPARVQRGLAEAEAPDEAGAN